MEEITNNPVDNAVNNMVEDSKALTPVEDLSKDMIEESRKAGRPPHLPNADTRNKVYMLSTVGTRHEDIASVLSISHDTLVKYYKEELDKGRIEANASVAETLFKQAKEGNTTAMIFWLKSRARWKESTQHEISGNPDGSPVEVKIITGIE
ncbi:putative DNA binding domain [Caudoviricetes sp.]|nr:MAG: putative DNA binding domain [Podoviridae sp. ct2cs2]UOF77502.1 putative DNA binding domain [Caudoviricetes sp.]